MKVTFKTLDQHSFEMEVGSEEGVEDLICKMEDKLGQENLYRLIYAGKMMHEREEAHNNHMEEDDEEEEEVGLVERNLRTMIGMGFAKEDAEEALSRSSGSLQVALAHQFRADSPRGDADDPREQGNLCGDALRANWGRHFEIRQASLTYCRCH